MSFLPCPNVIDCDGVESPVSNLSAELADPRKWFKRSFGPDSSTFCESTISQADADLCDPPPSSTFNVLQSGPKFASSAAAGGTIDYTAPSGVSMGLNQEAADQAAQQVADSMLEILNNLEVFPSQSQACVTVCEGGGNDYIAPAGSAYGLTQAEANASALAFACLVSTAICEGSYTLFPSSAQTCSVECANGGTITYTTNAGLFTGLSQAAADALAFGFACVVSEFLCSLAVLFPSAAKSCTVNCSQGGTRTFALPAGVFQATTQAEADFLSNLIACAIASITCDQALEASGTDPSDIQVYFGNSAQTCSVPCTAGGTFTLSTPASQFYRTSISAANAAAESFACEQAATARVCLSDIALTCCVGTAFADLILVTPDTAVTWTLTGTLPTGLTFDAGLITGIPSASGSFGFTVRATLTNGSYVQRSYTISAIEITTGALPAGEVTDPVTPYSATLAQTGAEEDVAPVTWSLVSGSLPPGLSLSSSGTISGGPTTEGAYGFRVRVTDYNGFFCEKNLSITVEEDFWSALVWGVPVLDNFGNPVSFTNGSWDGGSFSSDVQVSFPVGSDINRASNIGSFSYTGPARNCQMVINYDLSAGTAAVGNSITNFMYVEINAAGIGIVASFGIEWTGANFSLDPSSIGTAPPPGIIPISGQLVFTFTIPVSVGMSISVYSQVLNTYQSVDPYPPIRWAFNAALTATPI